MKMYDIIESKKQGKELTKEEIEYFVSGYTRGDIPDYQAAALAMAIYFNGMSFGETANLTAAMAQSGDMLDLTEFGNLSADKHSSGGVGDKTTLIAAPIAAAAGCVVAKMSGRGLGFTGGTVDKLESIPGFSAFMSPERFKECLRKHGIVLSGQTGNMSPCDKKLYALRDVTATVDCMPLVASSIMSKKLACGAKNIVLDIKCGSGAFMKSREQAQELADEMIKIGSHCGRNMRAVISDMNTPLGYAVGNGLEVAEAVKVLKGENISDVRILSLKLAAHMISCAKGIDFAEAYDCAERALDSGKALEKLIEAVEEQGGDVSYIENESKFELDCCSVDIKAQSGGYIHTLDALDIGKASVALGAGRNVKTDDIDPRAGIMLHAKPGDYVEKGFAVMTLYSSSCSKLESAGEAAKRAIEIKREAPDIINKLENNF